MKLWLDITRQRHIPFAVSLTRVLRARGYEFVLSASQPDYVTRLQSEIDGHEVALIETQRNLRNIFNLALTPKCVLQLANWARHQNIDMALSLDNPVQALSARLLKLKVAALLENPHDPDAQIIRRAAHFLGLPTYLSSREVDRLRLKGKPIVWRYQDAPEASYFDGFKPAPSNRVEFLQMLGWGDEEDDEHLPIVVYHPSVRSQPLLGPDKALRRLAKESALTVFLPAQKSTKSIKLPKSRQIKLCPAELDVRTLLMHADLVISRGPTLLKEAALLQTPSVWLSDAKAQNRLAHLLESGNIRQAPDLNTVLESRPDRRRSPAQPVVSHLASELVTQLESAVEILQ